MRAFVRGIALVGESAFWRRQRLSAIAEQRALLAAVMAYRIGGDRERARLMLRSVRLTRWPVDGLPGGNFGPVLREAA